MSVNGKRTVFFWSGKLLIFLSILSLFMSFAKADIKIISGHSKNFTGVYLIADIKDDVDCGEYTDETMYKGAETASAVITAALILAAAGLLLPFFSWIPSLLAAGTMAAFGVLCRYANDELSEIYTRKAINLRPDSGAYIFMALALLSAVLTITDIIIRKRRKSKKVSA